MDIVTMDSVIKDSAARDFSGHVIFAVWRCHPIKYCERISVRVTFIIQKNAPGHNLESSAPRSTFKTDWAEKKS